MSNHVGRGVLRNVVGGVLLALGTATGACSKADEAAPLSLATTKALKIDAAPAAAAPAADARLERPQGPAIAIPPAAPDRPSVAGVDPPKAKPTVPPRVEVLSVVVARAPQLTREDLLVLSRESAKLGADEGPVRFAVERWMEFQAVRLRQDDFIDETADKLRMDDQEGPTETLRIAGSDAAKPIDEEALQADIALLKDKRAPLVAVFGADRNLDFDRTGDVFVVKLRVANPGDRTITYVSGRFNVADAARKVFLRAEFENRATIAAGGSIDVDGTIPFRASAAHLVALEKAAATAKWTFKMDRTVYGK